MRFELHNEFANPDRFESRQQLTEFMTENIPFDSYTLKNFPEDVVEQLLGCSRAALTTWTEKNFVYVDAGGLYMRVPDPTMLHDYRRIRVELFDEPFDATGRFIRVDFLRFIYKPILKKKRDSSGRQPFMLLDNDLCVPYLGSAEDLQASWRMPAARIDDIS